MTGSRRGDVTIRWISWNIVSRSWREAPPDSPCSNGPMTGCTLTARPPSQRRRSPLPKRPKPMLVHHLRRRLRRHQIGVARERQPAGRHGAEHDLILLERGRQQHDADAVRQRPFRHADAGARHRLRDRAGLGVAFEQRRRRSRARPTASAGTSAADASACRQSTARSAPCRPALRQADRRRRGCPRAATSSARRSRRPARCPAGGATSCRIPTAARARARRS